MSEESLKNNSIKQILQVRRSGIFVLSCRQSYAGNIIIEFPTAEDKAKAKQILLKENKVLRDSDDRKVSLWVKYVDHKDLDEMVEEIKEMNSDLLKEVNFELAWVGKTEKSKRLKLTTNRNGALSILNAGRLFTEMESHPVDIWEALPFRCHRCLRFHNTSANTCKNAEVCSFCADTSHNSHSSPFRENTDRHQCETCRHHSADGTTEFTHNAWSKKCPVYEAEKEKVMKGILDFLSGKR